MANAQRIQRTLESAVLKFQSGDLDSAAALCSGLLQKQPKNHHALHILGAVRLRQNDPATALELLNNATKRDPRNVEVLANLGAAYRMSGDPEAAVAVLKKAVKLEPRNISAQLNLGNAACDANDPACAISAYGQVVALQPDHIDARKILARLYQEQGEPALALTELEIVCDHEGTDFEPFNRAGVLLAESGEHDRAIEMLQRASTLSPHDPDISINLANVLALKFDIDRAEALYREVLDRDPDCPDVMCNLGNALSRAGRQVEAAELYCAVIASHPDHADAHASLANNLLADGNFAKGWQHYLYRPSARDLPSNLYRASLPEDLSGKRIAVIADQGLGDQVFFARFLPMLADRGAHVVYRPEARLTDMLTRASVADEIAPESAPLVADFVVSAGDLPFLLENPVLDTPPPYDIPPIPERLAKLEDIMSDFGPRPWTGITWRAGTANVRLALSKEIPPTKLAEAFRDVDDTLIVIQRNCDPAELEMFQKAVGRRVLDLSNCNNDIEDLLALSCALDRYVGVSNTVTHLRAAARKPSDVLVPMPAEFRWMNTGEASPWFPKNTVLRQRGDGDWKTACNTLAENLKA